MTIENRVYQYVVEEEQHPAGAVIIREGGHGNWVYLVLEGSIKMKKKTPRGSISTETLGPGDIFGEDAIFHEKASPRTVSAVAQGEVVLGLLDTNRILEEFNRLSPQMRKLLSTLATRLQSATERVVELAAK